MYTFSFQESTNPVDEERRFVLSYFLANDMISIYEKPTRNTGIIGGKFLEKTQIPKPGSTVEEPDFYSPADFAIGSTVEGKSCIFMYLTNYFQKRKFLLPFSISFQPPFCVDGCWPICAHIPGVRREPDPLSHSGFSEE